MSICQTEELWRSCIEIQAFAMVEKEMNDWFYKLDIKKHTSCHKRFLSLLSSKFESEDSNKLAIAYFSLAALELMGTLHTTFNDSELQEFIDYIYSHLIESEQVSGFRGSLTYLDRVQSIDLASTCFALQCLIILGDGLSRIDKKKVIFFVQSCQKSNGGFTNTLNSQHAKDLRYCMIAATVCKILFKDLSAYSQIIDIKSLKKFIYGLQTYDGGFSMCKGDESHCGMVFCAIDALSLIDGDCTKSFHLNKVDELLDFLVHRQVYFGKYNEQEFLQNEYANVKDNGGFNGRLNKYADTCYVFWTLASLELLGFTHLIDKKATIKFLIQNTQNTHMGGFNKTTDEDEFPDPFHSFLGLSALSILKYPGIQSLNCQLVIPQSSYIHWESI